MTSDDLLLILEKISNQIVLTNDSVIKHQFEVVNAINSNQNETKLSKLELTIDSLQN